MMRKLTFILTFILSIVLNIAQASPNSTSQSSIVDSARVLNTQQKQSVQVALHNVEEKHQIRAVIVTVPYLSSNTTMQRYAHKVFKQYFSGAKEGNVLLLIDKNGRQWYITYDQKIALENKAERIFEKKIVPSLSKNDYYGAFMAYAQTTDQLVKKGLQARQKAVEKANSPMRWFNPKILLFSFIGALIIALLVWKWLSSSMKTIHPALAADNYLDEDSVEITNSSDNYLYTSTTVIPKMDHRPNSGMDGGMGGGMRGGGGRF